MQRDCGIQCPYAAHAPASAEAAAVWRAGTAAARIGPAGLEVDVAGAVALAAAAGVAGWAAAEMIAAFREGVDLGQAARRHRAPAPEGGGENG
ncbi:hypothetical protein [Rubritepida flocculans]|uniref:hypothetical protein n=1 Tax=Rubritepida flocculans TaxID=182403 RepID=UPI00056239E1|nr:hypothetical protein [Rubritepida flocculans]